MNLRKMLMIATFAGAATLAPTAAIAENSYPEDEDVTQCDLSGITAGSTFECVVSDDEGETAGMFGSYSTGDEVGIAGASATVTKALVDGTASFDISVPAAQGTLSLTTLVDGVVVDTVTVQVAEDGSVSVAQVSEDALTQTGFSNGPLAIGVVVLLAAGGTAVLVAARRSRQA